MDSFFPSQSGPASQLHENSNYERTTAQMPSVGATVFTLESVT
jgi:hypothetical protein